MSERDPKPWGRTADLVRTYKAVNSPDAPPWSVKFVGAIAAFALVLAAGGAVWYAATHDGAGSAPVSANVRQNEGGSRTDYVGVPASATVAPAQVDAAFAAWEAAHPGAEILSKEPVLHQGRLVGYHVTYRSSLP